MLLRLLPPLLSSATAARDPFPPSPPTGPGAAPKKPSQANRSAGGDCGLRRSLVEEGRGGSGKDGSVVGLLRAACCCFGLDSADDGCCCGCSPALAVLAVTPGEDPKGDLKGETEGFMPFMLRPPKGRLRGRAKEVFSFSFFSSGVSPQVRGMEADLEAACAAADAPAPAVASAAAVSMTGGALGTKDVAVRAFIYVGRALTFS